MSKVIICSAPYYPGLWANYTVELLQLSLKNNGIDSKTLHLHLYSALRLFNEGHFELLKHVQSDPFLGDAIVLSTYPDFDFSLSAAQIERHLGKIYWPTKKALKSAAETYVYTVNMLLEEIEQNNTEVVVFSATHYQLVPSLVMAKRVKECNQNLKVIIGGYLGCLATANDLLKHHKSLDYVCFGEGEVSLPKLIKGVLAGDIKERKVIEGEPVRSLIGVPNFDVYLSEIKAQGLISDTIVPYEISRGCYWDKCKFCNFNASYGRFKQFEVDTVLNAIRNSREYYGIRKFNLLDTSLPTSFARILRTYDIDWSDQDVFVEIMADWKEDDLILLRKFGVRRAQVGIESFSTEHLTNMGKGKSVLDNIRVLRACQTAEILPVYGIMLNMPGDKANYYSGQIKAIEKITHLTPPKYLSSFSLRTASPYYHQRKSFGITIKFSSGPFDWVLPSKPESCELKPCTVSWPGKEEINKSISILIPYIHEWQKRWVKKESHIQNDFKPTEKLILNVASEIVNVVDLEPVESTKVLLDNGALYKEGENVVSTVARNLISSSIAPI